MLRLNQNLKAAQKIARLGYWDLDLANNTLFWTDEVYNIWGTSPYYFKLSIDSFRATIHPDDLEKFDCHQQKALNGESDLEVEHRIMLPDGSVRYVYERGTVTKDKNGNAIRLEGTVQDITERKKTEEIIRASEEKSRLIMNAALDAIICIDLNGNITYWNPQAEKIFGWKEEEIAGTNVVDLVVPAFYRKWYERGIEVYRNTGTGDMLNTLIELSAIDKMGKVFPIELTVSAIRQGGEDFFCAFIRDISERKKAEEKLFSINEELSKRASELAVSNAELERFAYIASHDLQEPLRMVTSFLQLIEKKYTPLLDDTGLQYIHFAVDGANRMKQLILDLLEYSRAGTNKEITGNTDMNEVVAEALQVMNERIEELNAVIITGTLPVLPNTRKTQLAQLMLNLISNALKYHGEERLQISIGVKEEAASWEFYVKDNGIGIDKMFSEKIFILFQRLHSKSEYSGTGIGLAICKKIVEQHNGRIWVESEAGKGSSFYFSLPK
jgi:PAS domain S-box-containing protein